MNCPECGHSADDHTERGCYYDRSGNDLCICRHPKSAIAIEDMKAKFTALQSENARMRAENEQLFATAKIAMEYITSTGLGYANLPKGLQKLDSYFANRMSDDLFMRLNGNE